MGEQRMPVQRQRVTRRPASGASMDGEQHAPEFKERCARAGFRSECGGGTASPRNVLHGRPLSSLALSLQRREERASRTHTRHAH